jgi:hypothetical protein
MLGPAAATAAATRPAPAVAPPVDTSAAALHAAFRILDGVSSVLDLSAEGRGPAVAGASASLHARFAGADALLDSLPGAELTHARQLEEAAGLLRELEEKRALVEKHRGLVVLGERCAAVKLRKGDGDALEVGKGGEADAETTQADAPAKATSSDADAAGPGAETEGDAAAGLNMPGPDDMSGDMLDIADLDARDLDGMDDF